MTTLRKLPQRRPKANVATFVNQPGNIAMTSSRRIGIPATLRLPHSMLVEINRENPEPRKIRRAVDALEAGEVIGYPTDTVYGLGCDLMNKRAVDRLYSIKGMDRSHPLAFICPDLANIAQYAVVENQVYRVLR